MYGFTSRLSDFRISYFFDPIKKLKLVTFTSMNKIKACRENSCYSLANQQKSLCKNSINCSNTFNLRLVFKFPFGPLPWSLAEPIGTSKPTFLHKPEGKVGPIENLSGRYAMITDRMVYVHQAQVSNKTLGQLAMNLVDRISLSGMRAA